MQSKKPSGTAAEGTAAVSPSPKSITLFGAHRGGTQATAYLLAAPALPSRDPLPMVLPPLKIKVVDLEPGRAATFAAGLAQSGFQAHGTTGDAGNLARDTPRDDLEIIALDTAPIQARLLRTSRAGLVLMGLVVGSPHPSGLGGRVLAYGAVVPENDAATQGNALRLFGLIAGLAGDQRITSRALREPFFNLPQVSAARAALYRALAEDGRRFLAGQMVPGRLVVAAAWPRPGAFALVLRERPSGMSHAAMRNEAAEIAARSVGAGRAAMATAFLRDGQLYTVLPYPGETVTAELPEAEAEVRLWAERARLAAAASKRAIYTSD